MPFSSSQGHCLAVQSLGSLISADLGYICDDAYGELSRMAGKTVWFTGAAGFLGYYFCKTIKYWNDHHQADNKITLFAIDNFGRGVPRWLEDIASPHLSLVKHNVTEPPPRSIARAEFIVHAASIASPPFYRAHPVETIDANVLGIRHLLEHGAASDVEAILFFSTSEIYGDPPDDEIPTAETFRGLVSCTGPRACYDESKRLGETLCVVFAQQHSLPVKIARPFNNYGPGLRLSDGRVLPDFAQCVLRNQDIVMLSDGRPTRTFCYVADAIIGYLKLLIRGASGASYNIGMDAEETSVAELAELVAEQARDLWGYTGQAAFGRSSDMSYLTDNPNRRCPDITKARTELGFSPKVTLKEGVRRSLTWYFHLQDDREL